MCVLCHVQGLEWSDKDVACPVFTYPSPSFEFNMGAELWTWAHQPHLPNPSLQLPPPSPPSSPCEMGGSGWPHSRQSSCVSLLGAVSYTHPFKTTFKIWCLKQDLDIKNNSFIKLLGNGREILRVSQLVYWYIMPLICGFWIWSGYFLIVTLLFVSHGFLWCENLARSLHTLGKHFATEVHINSVINFQ